VVRNKTQITTCIIPAAGKGSRWAPISGYLPKEMLPLIDKPVIHWVIDEVIDSGCTKIIVVINNSKEIVKEYLSKQKFGKNIKIHYVYQDKPKGVAHVIYLSKKYLDSKPFALAMPDLPTISKKPALLQLIKVSKSYKNVNIISFDKFPPQDLKLYGECELDKIDKNIFNVVAFRKSKLNLRMSGRFIFQPNVISTIKPLLKSTKCEVSDQDLLKKSLNLGEKIIGVKIQGRTYDTGTPTGYVRANTAFFKKKFNITS